MAVKLGDVETFRVVSPDKDQALKVLEEAAEVFGAWQRWFENLVSLGCWDAVLPDAERDLVDECADVIQATCNLLAALGVEDARPAMGACRERNERRGWM